MSSPRNNPQRLDGAAAQEIEGYIYILFTYLDFLVFDLVIIVYDILYTHCCKMIVILHAM